MKTKLVLWGKNAQDERILIALQLRPQENKVDLWTFSEKIATEDFSQKMLNEWRNGIDLDFPEGFTHSEKELSITESLLPEDLKVERGDLIQRAQTEWHFMVLSSKLNETYQTELQEIKEKVAQLNNYSGDVWEELKGFWAKVQTQVRERNLFREHANDLRDSTNELFGKMKELRKSLDKEFQSKSEEHMNMFKTGLGEIKERLEKGLNLNGIFEDLKKIQREFKDTKFSREHRSTIWDQLDGLFKEVKNKRYGGDSNSNTGNSTPSERLRRRYDGLMAALGKMEQSINRDKRELDFQNRKAGQSGGQLEAQLREAKMMMVKERIRSKEEKLSEMLQTKAELEKRIEVQKEKDIVRAEKEKVKEAKAEAAQKIKAKIKADEAARAGDNGKLKEAAEKLKDNEATAPEESSVEKIATEIEETLENVVDTVKAVAHVVSEKIDQAVENFKVPDAEKEKADGVPANDELKNEEDGVEKAKNENAPSEEE
jgi:prophage DNA circulation protein